MRQSEETQAEPSSRCLNAEDLDTGNAHTDVIEPVSPEGDEPGSDGRDSGRLKKIANSALALGKQTTESAVVGSREAAEVVASATAVTAQAVGDGVKKATASGASAAQIVGETAKTAAAASASAAQAVGSGATKVGAAGGRAVATGAQRLFDSTSERTAQLFAAAQGLVASDLSPQLNDLVQAAVKGKAIVYDKAMDAEYLATHIGGGNHRLFDGGHTLLGAIKATHGASPDDTFIQEALGGMQGLLRDMSTPKGLPLANWDKPTYDSVANSLHSTFGIPKDWFYDLNSYDVGELLGSAVGVVSLIFGWNKAETESFASLATGMGMSATVSANPLLLAVSVVAFGRAFHKANHADEYVELAEGGLKGAIGTGSSLGAIALVGVAGGPAGVALLAGVAAGVLAHVATKDVTLDAIHSFVKNDARSVMGQIAAQAAAFGDGTASLAARAGSAVARGASAAADVVGEQTSQAGQVIAAGAALAGSATAEASAAAGRATADAARAAGRAGAAATTATHSAVESAARRVKALVDRNEPEDPEVDLKIRKLISQTNPATDEEERGRRAAAQ